MQLLRLHPRLIKPDDDLAGIIVQTIESQGLSLKDNDLVAITSKVVATAEGRIRSLRSVRPSRKTERLANQSDLEPAFVEIVLQEAEKVYGGVPKALLTLKNGILTANAGVDRKNAPEGCVALWPSNPHLSAEKIRRELQERTGRHVGVLIVDSRVTPLRMGTIGLALGVAGFNPVEDCRSEKDLYGKPVNITRQAVADDLASAAHLLMGESDERSPMILIRGAPVRFIEEVDPDSVKISEEQCLFACNRMSNPLRREASCPE